MFLTHAEQQAEVWVEHSALGSGLSPLLLSQTLPCPKSLLCISSDTLMLQQLRAGAASLGAWIRCTL